MRNPDSSHVEYRVHYAGWNTRYDEWIKSDAIVSVIDARSADATASASGKQKQSSSTVSVIAANYLLHALCYFFTHIFVVFLTCETVRFSSVNLSFL